MRRAPQGFSLIELLMSLAILGILASISFGAWSGVSAVQVRYQTEAALSAIEAALGAYYLDEGSYPDSLATLSVSRIDPWGNAYFYEKKARNGYVLLSAGPDGLVAKPFDHDNVRCKK